VKDIRIMNVSLLAKWQWRLLDGEKSLWKEVLEEKYGPYVGVVLEGSNGSWPRYVSLWWKDLVKLGDFGARGWFNSEVICYVGNGLNTSFWNVKWKAERCFRLKYPRLFMISNQKEALVGEMGLESEEGREWIFTWRQPFCVGRGVILKS